MAKLHPDEREALRQFRQLPPLPQPAPPVLPIMDYLRTLSRIPTRLRPLKAVRFTGTTWKL